MTKKISLLLFEEWSIKCFKCCLLMIQVIFVWSCSAFEGDQKTNVNAIIKTQEIKQLSQADVMVTSELFGESVLKRINALTLNCDSSRFRFLIDSLAISFNGRITIGQNANDFLLKEEKDLLEAYQYNLNRSIKTTNAVQLLDGKTAIYSVPILDLSKYCKVTAINRDSTFGMLSIIYPTKSAINSMN